MSARLDNWRRARRQRAIANAIAWTYVLAGTEAAKWAERRLNNPDATSALAATEDQ